MSTAPETCKLCDYCKQSSEISLFSNTYSIMSNQDWIERTDNHCINCRIQFPRIFSNGHQRYYNKLTEEDIAKMKKTNSWYRLENLLGTYDQYLSIINDYPDAYDYMPIVIRELPEFYLPACNANYGASHYVPYRCKEADPRIEQILMEHRQKWQNQQNEGSNRIIASLMQHKSQFAKELDMINTAQESFNILYNSNTTLHDGLEYDTIKNDCSSIMTKISNNICEIDKTIDNLKSINEKINAANIS
jgi:hypothetical protein